MGCRVCPCLALGSGYSVFCKMAASKCAFVFLQTFLNSGISGAPVVDDDNKVVGILSEGDILWKAAGAEDYYIIPPMYIAFAGDLNVAVLKVARACGSSVFLAESPSSNQLLAGGSIMDPCHNTVERNAHRVHYFDCQGFSSAKIQVTHPQGITESFQRDPTLFGTRFSANETLCLFLVKTLDVYVPELHRSLALHG